MLPSDPSPKATSVPPTIFKVGDRVRLKRPDLTGNGAAGPVVKTGEHYLVFKTPLGEYTAYNEGVELIHDEPVKPANNVDHPSHYTAGSIETIDAIEAMVGQAGWSPLTGYRLGNVLKYLWRHVHKGGLESLKKAAWYLEREIEAQETAQEKP
jgi:Protein of unknwon function (DUF3310).